MIIITRTLQFISCFFITFEIGLLIIKYLALNKQAKELQKLLFFFSMKRVLKENPKLKITLPVIGILVTGVGVYFGLNSFEHVKNIAVGICVYVIALCAGIMDPSKNITSWKKYKNEDDE